MSLRRFTAYFVALSTCSTIAFASFSGQSVSADAVNATGDTQVAARPAAIHAPTPRMLPFKLVWTVVVAAVRD